MNKMSLSYLKIFLCFTFAVVLHILFNVIGSVTASTIWGEVADRYDVPMYIFSIISIPLAWLDASMEAGS